MRGALRAIGPSSVLLALAAAAPAIAQTEASPVPTSMPEGSMPSPVPTGSGAPTEPAPSGLDAEAARHALASILYKDCGKGGPGKILVTFNSKGTVERVVLAEGTFQPDVAVCITRRFSEATVPPFEGANHTVKWSVALEGGAPPAPASYAPASPYPTHPVRYGTGDEVMPADNGPAPYGYHREERRRVGALVSGGAIMSVGLIFAAMSYEDSRSRSDNEVLQTIALIHVAVGLPLFIVGLTKREVFVADQPSVSLTPVVTKNGATFGLAVRF